MEFIAEIKTNVASEISKFKDRNGKDLPTDILDISRFHEPSEWIDAFKAVKWDSGVTKEMNIGNTPENRASVVISYLRDYFEETMPGVISKGELPSEDHYGNDKFHDNFSLQVEYFMRRSILKDVPVLLDGKKYKDNFEKNPNSLERHDYRTGVIKRVLVTRLFKSAETNNPIAIEFKDSYLNRYKNVGIGFLQGFSHDWGRWADQSSKHEEWTEKIITGVFPKNISDLILEGIHKPVSNSQRMNSVEIENFDSKIQMLNRVADLFGKVTEGNKIRNLDELIIYSRNRQTKYLNEEVKNPESEWYQKSSDSLNIYLDNEEKVLKNAINWLEKAGVSWNDLVNNFNQNLAFKSQDDHNKRKEGYLSLADMAREV